MEQMYNEKMKELGYDQLVCEIFDNWESVKDEILIPERKAGSGNGTIHVFLGAADFELRKEFPSYYSAVENGEDPAISAVKVTHYFLTSNIISMLGYVCQYCYTENQNIGEHVNDILNTLSQTKTQKGFLTATSLFKLSLGSNKLRPYFKQFNNDGAFTKIIRKILLPDSSYKISLYKNENNEYAAFWLFGFDWLSDFEADSNGEYLEAPRKDNLSLPFQQIFYGAPGTGKSNTIKKVVDEQGKKCIRTTFHPDSDYSTFVGCYKPSMKQEERIYSTGELIVKLKEIKTSGVTYPCHKFAAQYWKSLKDLSSEQIKEILRACDFTDSMTVEIGKGIAIGQEYLNKNEDGKIVYKFCPQAFTNAYVEAWNTEEEVYLIIEEINRGNCAQIFGDLFQLLDRNAEGFSEYPIEADTDLRNHLAENLACSTRTNIPQEVKEGKRLILPNNLYIWATMNTSDQSLFPIDSAFKRRWDWQYMPICKGRDAKGEELQWAICAEGKRYDWWSFLEKINAQIGSTTNSEDKKLGYFFCKPVAGCISAETFVGKVVFYLWNDVFKDYGFDNTIFNDDEGGTLSFDKFYTTNHNGKVVVCEDKVVKFLENLGVEDEDINDLGEDDEENNDENGDLNVTFPDGTIITGKTRFDSYISTIKKIGIENIKSIIPNLKYKRLGAPLISLEKYDAIVNSNQRYSYVEVEGCYFIKGMNGRTMRKVLLAISKLLKLNLNIEYK